MTNEEAYEELLNWDIGKSMDKNEALRIARDAVEKQIVRAPVDFGFKTHFGIRKTIFTCPNCFTIVSRKYNFHTYTKHCNRCGQRISFELYDEQVRGLKRN